MKESSRIAFNTIILYVQLVISVAIALFSTRWVLQSLGTEDFGIYNLVAGVIAMLAFLNTAMSGASQRFLSYALGQGSADRLKEVFYYTVVLHLAIGVIVLLLLEIGGVYLLQHVLVIPEGKVDVSLFVLHCLTLSTFVTILTVPYQAVLNAHENIPLIAIMALVESVLKFITAYQLLTYQGNRLQLYALLMMLIPLVTVIVMRIYCKRHYPETKVSFHRISDGKFFREIIQYVWWNLLGTIANLCRNQGISFILNLFNGVKINAAYGIANQVNGQTSFLSSSIIRVARPAIIREIGANNTERALRLSVSCCRFTFLLMTLCAIPLIVEMPFVLQLWLKTVPDYAVQFCQLIMVMTIINQLTPGLFIAIEGSGNIKAIQIVISTLHILVLPIGLLCMYLGFSPLCVMIVMIMEEIVAMFARIYIVGKQFAFSMMHFLLGTILPQVLVTIVVLTLSFMIARTLSTGWGNLVVVTLFSVLAFGSIYYAAVLKKDEKNLIMEKVNQLFRRP